MTTPDPGSAPYGYDVRTHTEVIPRPPPVVLHWRIGPVLPKQQQPPPSDATFRRPFNESEITVQLTADQQVDLSVKGEDRYGNPVSLGGDTVWESSDPTIIGVQSSAPESATATAVGPAGTASVTVTNDADRDGSGDFIGSIAIDVVAGEMAEIVIEASAPADKPA